MREVGDCVLFAEERVEPRVSWTGTGMELEESYSIAREDNDVSLEVKDDFKSLDPRLEVPEDIWDVVGEALPWQKLFIRKTSPWEMVEWEPGELESYTVEDDRVTVYITSMASTASVWMVGITHC